MSVGKYLFYDWTMLIWIWDTIFNIIGVNNIFGVNKYILLDRCTNIVGIHIYRHLMHNYTFYIIYRRRCRSRDKSVRRCLLEWLTCFRQKYKYVADCLCFWITFPGATLSNKFMIKIIFFWGKRVRASKISA